MDYSNSRLILFPLLICSLCLMLHSTLLAKGLQTEAFLHPMDAFSAETLEQGEWVYNQSLFTFPIPSWIEYGLTDFITVEFDTLPLIGGFFQEPYKPVPSFNFRVQILKGGKGWPKVALEAMYQYLYVFQSQLDSDDLEIERRGNSYYYHLNTTWTLSRRLFMHISVGESFAEQLRFVSKNKNDQVTEFEDSKIFDYSLGFDFRYSPSLSFHAALSRGTTFVYLDNIPRKRQITYGFRLAPFLGAKWSIFKNLRAEFVAFYMTFDDIDESSKFELPIVPYLYWQWQT